MGRRRGMQQLIDSATRLVLAYNQAVLFDYDAPDVGLTILKGSTMIYVDDGEHKYIYGGPKPAEGRTLKEGVAHVKRLWQEHREVNADAENAGD